MVDALAAAERQAVSPLLKSLNHSRILCNCPMIPRSLIRIDLTTLNLCRPYNQAVLIERLIEAGIPQALIDKMLEQENAADLFFWTTLLHLLFGPVRQKNAILLNDGI